MDIVILMVTTTREVSKFIVYFVISIRLVIGLPIY